MLGLLSSLAVIVGVGAGVGGVGYAINGVTQAGADVDVAVTIRDETKLLLPLTAGTGPDAGVTNVPLRQPGYDVENEPRPDAIELSVPGQADTTVLRAEIDPVVLEAWDSTALEQMLSRGHFAVLGLCAAAGAAFLFRLLTSITEGRPFRPGNAACIAGLAGLVAIGMLATEILPALAADLVLSRLGLGGADSPVYSELRLPLLEVALAVTLLLALAEAFRRGTEQVREVDGLV
ncbi:MAG TPA: hypothetical protein VGR21_06795 [Cryptosporangiaceae bacterium]|nr:hypothetical protein [Cryptosporangiaceae bacterium]